MVPHRHPAGDLDVNDLIGFCGGLPGLLGKVMDQLLNEAPPARRVMRVGDAQLCQRTAQARHVLVKAEQLPAIHRHHLIHAVTKDEAAVQNADAGLAQRAVNAVQVARRGRKKVKFVGHGCDYPRQGSG